ncbi:MAG: SAM hydroxide adenosyltransferase, partial [Geminicoccaceae bacterium]
RLDYQKPEVTGEALVGTIPILDIQFGNVWTNIDRETFEEMGVEKGEALAVAMLQNDQVIFEGEMPYVSTFGDVPEGEPLAYLNSVNNLSFAINWGNFAETHGVSSGADWRVEVTRP